MKCVSHAEDDRHDAKATHERTFAALFEKIDADDDCKRQIQYIKDRFR